MCDEAKELRAPLTEDGEEDETMEPIHDEVRVVDAASLSWRLRHPSEFFWEPVRKRLHRNRQLRIERDYWKMCFEAAELRLARYEAGLKEGEREALAS